MGRFTNSGRFMYAAGYVSRESATFALYDMINACEMAEHGEAEIEPYKMRKDGKTVTRYAITVAL